MKVTTNTKYGGSAKNGKDGFAIAATAEIDEKQIGALASIGLASVLYRAGANAMNKALDVENNSETEYTDNRAQRLSDALAEWAMSEDSPLEGGFELNAEISRHVHGQAADSKFTAERAKYASKGGDATKLAALAKAVGYDGEIGDGTGTNAPQEFLVAIRKWVRAQADAL